MIRCCAKLISQDCSKYSRLCLQLKTDFTTKKPCKVLFEVRNLCSSKQLSSLQGSAIEKDDVSQISQDPVDPQMVPILEIAKNLGFKENDIKRLVKVQPGLMNTSSDSWDNVVGTLLQSGFEKANILSILYKWPEILQLKKIDLDKNLGAWMDCTFGNDLLVKVLTTYPTFLQVDHNHVTKRTKQYQIYFESRRRVGKLYLLAPNTLEEKWTELIDKLNYLDELCTEKSDVVATGVLAHSAFHIKARHEFLIRAGLYKRPTKSFHKRLSKNPKLHRIVNTPENEFVFKVAGLSMFEYSVFLEMFEEELAESEPNCDSDSDDEDRKLNYSVHRRNRKNKSSK